MDSAIDSRTTVGVIGLATAAWAGLGWMANLREALSQMWGQLPRGAARLPEDQAVGSGGAAVAVPGHCRHRRADRARATPRMQTVLKWLDFAETAGVGLVLRVGVDRGLGGGVLAAVHLDHRPAAARVGQLPQRRAGRADRRGRRSRSSSGSASIYLSRWSPARRARRSVRCWASWCSPTSPRGWSCSPRHGRRRRPENR